MPNRREFLQAAFGSSAVLSLGVAAPSFLLEASHAAEQTNQQTVLVIVQMSGGNDGLNTVIPYGDDAYRKSRPTLAVSPSDVLKINDQLGFHPSLRGFAGLLEAGQLAVVQGVGYPNPNRSHFESMDIWHTCRRKGSPRTTGWLGRFLDASHSAKDRDAMAVHLGAEKQPLALAADTVRVPSISSLDRFRLQDGGDPQLRSTISQLSAQQRQDDSLLSFVQTSTQSALEASQRVEEATRTYQTPIQYPDSALAAKLRTVAQLIDAGLQTRVYYTAIDGFDTHSRQAAAHEALLRQVGDATAAFIQDVGHHGHADRVVVMAFSEFGRRVSENASKGTDHGAAAPMFLAGTRVRSGLFGNHPSLTDLEDGDIKHHTDFRQVYAAALQSWLGWSSGDVIGGDFEPIGLFA